MSELLHPGTKICNCARCGCELIGQASAAWWHALTAAERKELDVPGGVVAGRVRGRPFCAGCLRTVERRLECGAFMEG